MFDAVVDAVDDLEAEAVVDTEDVTVELAVDEMLEVALLVPVFEIDDVAVDETVVTSQLRKKPVPYSVMALFSNATDFAQSPCVEMTS